MADTLARIHALPLPPARSPIPRQKNPFLETLEAIELNAMRFLDKAVPDFGARAEIAEELRLMRGMALAFAQRAQPLTVALADTHPGNFIVDREGLAWFVDLEKVHVGSPAIDLAHATLPTSTLWHPDVGKMLSRAEVQGFYDTYLEKVGKKQAASLQPWLVPMRRLTWLRTTLFMARWRVQTRSPRDPADPTQWSDAGLEPAMKAHIDARIDQCFSARHDSVDPRPNGSLDSFPFCSHSRPIMRPTVPPDYPDDAIAEPVHRGRGALSNEFEPLRQRAADPHDRRMGDRSLRAAVGRRRAAAAAHDADARRHAHHHRAQHLARHRLRPFDQSLSRLRAWLHLLLRAADPRLSRPLARPRFRDQDPVQARRREAAHGRARRAEIPPRRHRHGHQHRSLPAGRARAQDHAPDPARC